MINLKHIQTQLTIDEFDEKYPKELFLKYGVFFVKDDTAKYIAVPNENMMEALAFLSHYEFSEDIVHIENYDNMYNDLLDMKKADEKDDDIEDSMDDDEEILDFLKNSEDLLKSEESAPIIQFVNRMFYQSIKQDASDIHVEPSKDESEIRFRVNGVLHKYITIPKSAVNSIVNRIKVVSNLDISEKRIPQDGRTQITIAGKKLDIRVSTLPVHAGERIVMRVLMQADTIPTIEQLGLSDDIAGELKKNVKSPHGIILVTGPTGSGKSTTLYSLLQMIKSSQTNIMTIEDPVEYNLSGISQTSVNVKAGLTFAKGLRSILRQDPDVVLIGEMRDKETSQIAIQASLTGHLVFSTLHTNDSASSITRLIDIGVENFLISSSLISVLAQRLVRRLCDDCKEETSLDEYEANLLKIDKNTKVYKEVGCAKCNNSGFSGRIAVGELLQIDSKIKQMIQEGANDYTIKNYAINDKGMKTLKDRGVDLLVAGQTTSSEVIKLSMDNE
ncbi:type II secretion system ATPase GspE [Arcobacter sp. 15-2]